ncbi:ankyrin repeat-containing domain protein [Ochromonadaceae sp. CCMP2298]|nr:ankyrin repeat-containing domain protein [Ochromonadaceae sp. CCMP2298]
MFDPFPDTNNSSIDQCLVRAVLDGELRDAETILQAGVDPNSRCPQLGTTPLMLAAEDNKKDIMHLLIKHGAEVNLQDNLGETALMKAARDCHPQAVKVLLDNGAQTDILNYESMKASDVTLSNEIDEILAAHEAGKGMLA